MTTPSQPSFSRNTPKKVLVTFGPVVSELASEITSAALETPGQLTARKIEIELPSIFDGVDLSDRKYFPDDMVIFSSAYSEISTSESVSELSLVSLNSGIGSCDSVQSEKSGKEDEKEKEGSPKTEDDLDS